ncbi:hypothetical protein L0Z72_14630 [candidate division KSB1 bacterium]|nr:hypothetical protein [candidate division KSB1 bacterium]
MKHKNEKLKRRDSKPDSETILNLCGSLYPDKELPEDIDNLTDRIDFIARLCSAWDFGLLPYPVVLKEILKEEWREAVAETNLLTSCAYHLVRELHNLEPVPYLGPKFPHILNDPCLKMV